MRHTNKTIVALAVALALAGVAPRARALIYPDQTEVNLLRQYDRATGNLLTSITGNGSPGAFYGVMNGGWSGDQVGAGSGIPMNIDITLSEVRKASKLIMDYTDYWPETWSIYYSDTGFDPGGGGAGMNLLASGGYSTTNHREYGLPGGDDGTSIKYLRILQTTRVTPSDYIRIGEIQLKGAVNNTLDDSLDGYNLLANRSSLSTITAYHSENPNVGVDNDPISGYVRPLADPPPNWFVVPFTKSYTLWGVNLGFYDAWGNTFISVSNDEAMPDPSGDRPTLGWTELYANPSSQGTAFIKLPETDARWLRVQFSGGNALTEMEVYGAELIPEPTAALLFGLGGLALFGWRRQLPGQAVPRRSLAGRSMDTTTTTQATTTTNAVDGLPNHRREIRAMSKPQVLISALAVLLGIGGTAPQAAALVFSNPTLVNVLREYNSDGTRAGSRSTTYFDGTSTSAVTGYTADGSGNKTQVGAGANGTGFDVAGTVVTETYTLSSAQTVGSWNFQNTNPGRNPTSMVLSGYTGSGWVLLDTYSPLSSDSNITRTFGAQTVTQLRLDSNGPNLNAGDAWYQMYEVQVFLDSSVSQPLYGLRQGTTPVNPAYNYLRDANPTLVPAPDLDISSSGWLAPDGSAISNWTPPDDPVNNIKDGLYAATYVRDFSAIGTNPYAHIKMDFASPLQMDLAHLGWYEGQSWNNFALYASALSSPDPNAPGDWTSIYSTTGSSGQELLINFGANSGEYQHLLLLWKGGGASSGAMTEFELFGFAQIPEPGSALLLGLGGLALWGMRRRSRR